MNLTLKLSMPDPGASKPEEKQDIESEIRESIRLAESNKNSSIEWRALRAFYDHLCKCKKTEKTENLKKMLRPVLSKYGYHKGIE